MTHVLRPLIQSPRWCRRCSILSHFPCLSPYPTHSSAIPPFISSFSTHALSRSRLDKLRNVPPFSDANESVEESYDNNDEKKSRNEKKREARRAVRWGMDLANFSPSQIKRILRVADLEQEVFDAIMLVKRLSRDVREGKRRQYNYIGRLLREAEPELMDGLIQAIKDGDESKFHDLPGIELIADDREDEEVEISDVEEEEEDSTNMAVVTRWFDGLINKDVGITNEIYSLREVEFDRQELRQLVRKVQSVEVVDILEETGKTDAAAAATNARRSLTRFLRGLANQLPVE